MDRNNQRTCEEAHFFAIFVVSHFDDCLAKRNTNVKMDVCPETLQNAVCPTDRPKIVADSRPNYTRLLLELGTLRMGNSFAGTLSLQGTFAERNVHIKRVAHSCKYRRCEVVFRAGIHAQP